MILALAIAAILQLPSDSIDPVPGDAYLDSGAERIVALARAHADSANGRIQAYEMVAKQRISAGLRAFGRDRVMFRRVIASRVAWRKDGPRRIEVLGARQTIPIALPGVQSLDDRDLERSTDLSIDPVEEDWLMRVPGSTDDADQEEFIHPLAPGSEAHYRYRSGDTTAIRLADGTMIRLIELQVLPRRSESDLLRGSFWLDAATHAPVRGIFTLAAPWRFTLDARAGALPVPVPDASFSIRYLTVEYGFWEGQWWLPRLIALEGSATLGGFEMPVTFQQSYEDYQIHASGEPIPSPAPVDTALYRTVERKCVDVVEPGDRDEEDSQDATDDSGGISVTVDVDAEDPSDGCQDRLVVIPRDSLALVQNVWLPGSIYDSGNLVTSAELARVADFLGGTSYRGMLLRQPRFEWDPLDASLIHYNRVEGLTLGSSARIELDPLSASADVWLGLADTSPGFELNFGRSRYNGSDAIALYRQLEAFTPEDRPFSLGSSVSALGFGRDDGDYYRTLGASFTTEQDPGGLARFRATVYAERQRAVEKQTDASIAHWVDGDVFRENPVADEADQLGVDLTLRMARGLNPNGFRGALEIGMQAERGTFSFARPAFALTTGFPLPGPLVGAAELSGGTSFGQLPIQRRWYVGGPSTVRGFTPAQRISGEAFWRFRGEIGNDFPGARVVLFSDAGWAGSRDAFTTRPLLVSAGVGASFLDGLIRADLTRTLRGAHRWGVDLYLDAPL